MQPSRIVVTGDHAELERELRTRGQLVFRVEDNATALSFARRVDACVLESDQLNPSGLDLIKHARTCDPGMAILLAEGNTASPEFLRERLLESGADELIRSESTRPAATHIETAIGRRRERLARALESRSRRVLVMDWHPSQTPLVRSALSRAGFETAGARDPGTALKQLRAQPFGAMVCPPALLPTGPSLIEAALRFDPALRVVVVSRQPDLSDTLAALGTGASDYLLEPVGPKQAVGVVEGAWTAYQEMLNPKAATSSVRVLLVDKSHAQADVMRQLLTAVPGVLVHTSPRLDAAIEALSNTAFDAVLCCPDLGETSALIAIHALRSRIPNVPLLLLAHDEQPTWYRAALDLGADDIISKKNIDREALPQRIQSAIARGRYQAKRQRLLTDVQTREASQEEVVRRSRDGMLVIDNRGIVLFANPAAERMFGKATGELLGTSLPIDGATPGPIEVEIPGPEALFAERTAVDVDWNGAKAALLTLRDVTERRNARLLRERLMHSDRLAAIGQLAAGVAHEINNPSAFVVANLLAMQKQLRPLADEANVTPELSDLRELLEENLQGMERIQTISRDLKAFARIDSDELQWVDVNDCVEVACKLAFHEIRQRAQLVRQSAELPRIAASPGRLAQVFTNLLVNAAQATPEGDAANHRITVTTAVEQDEVIVIVEDSGSGIPEHHLARLFEPFFTTKAPSQGTGLGLSLCADIVRYHRGQIRARNRAERGAAFEVRLPISDGLAVSSRKPRLAQRATTLQRRLRILLVDDEPMVLRSFTRMLAHHDVVTALGGRQALEKLATDTNFDLIVCDLMMPDMDGPGVHERLSQARPELVNKLVFCSGGAFTPRTRGFLERSSRPVLHKPLTLEEFEETAAQLCGSATLESVRP